MVEDAQRLKPWVEDEEDKSPVRAAQSACIALTGLNLNPICNPGFQSPLRVLFHPGLSCSALSALVPLSLTRMPEGAAQSASPFQGLT